MEASERVTEATKKVMEKVLAICAHLEAEELIIVLNLVSHHCGKAARKQDVIIQDRIRRYHAQFKKPS